MLHCDCCFVFDFFGFPLYNKVCCGKKKVRQPKSKSRRKVPKTGTDGRHVFESRQPKIKQPLCAAGER